MQWYCEGIAVSTRLHGENHVILGVLTRDHGFHKGYVYGGAGRRKRPLLEPGNLLDLHWSSRLEENLGTFSVELVENYAAALFHDKVRLAALGSVTALLYRLPEREMFPGLYHDTVVMLDILRRDRFWYSALILWEVHFLESIGFALDLDKCAVTGEEGGLAFVSPKTGRAVTADVGRLYAGRLLVLPPFLQKSLGQISGPAVSAEDIRDGFRLTSFFMDKVFTGHFGAALPAARGRAITYITDSLGTR